MPSIRSILYGIVAAAPLLQGAVAQIGGVCPGPQESQPNPISKKPAYKSYPSTGTVNGSIAILPIDFTLARSLIPAQYRILKKQYKAWLPSLPADQYPLVLQMELNHDIYHKGVKAGAAADYNSARVSFPFVDRLGDGYTAMAYNKEIIITSKNKNAIAAWAQYGSDAEAGYFATCNAYEYENGTANLALPPKQRGVDQAAWTNSNQDLSNPDIAYRLKPQSGSPWPTNFYYNITNQPIFSDKAGCDSVRRLPSTKVSLAPYAPVHVHGSAAVLKPVLPKGKTVWEDIWGLKLDQSYWEKDHVGCGTLKGWTVVKAP